MKPADLILRCYAERDSDGTWFAMCIDLNLYARADNLAGVKRKLHHFILDYVREALTDDVQYVNHLMPRPAPLNFRIRYHVIALKVRLHAAAKRWVTFTETLPVVPA